MIHDRPRPDVPVFAQRDLDLVLADLARHGAGLKARDHAGQGPLIYVGHDFGQRLDYGVITFGVHESGHLTKSPLRWMRSTRIVESKRATRQCSAVTDSAFVIIDKSKLACQHVAAPQR